MLTFNANHLRAIRDSGSKLIVLVRLDISSPSTIVRFVSGDKRFSDNGYPNSVESITPVSSALDPMTRASSIGQMTVTFVDDGALALPASAYIIKNQKCTITLGDQSHAEADFEELFMGAIDDFQRREGAIDLHIQDYQRVIEDQKFFGAYYGDHPLVQIQDLLEYAGVSTDLYSLASLVPSQYTTMSHWGVSRCGRDHPSYPWANREVVTAETGEDKEGEPIKDAIDDLNALMIGSLYPAEDGQATFEKFDGTAAIVDTWTDDDIHDANGFEQISNYEYMANKVSVLFNIGEKNPYGKFVAEDVNSQGFHAFPGGDPHVVEHEIPTNWINARSVLLSDITSGSTTITIGPQTGDNSIVNCPSALGFSGACFTPAQRTISAGSFSGTQESWRQLSAAAGRYAYLLINDRSPASANEIIRVREPVTFSSTYVQDQDNLYYFPRTVTYTIDARAQLDTTQNDHHAYNQQPVIDVTIPAAITPTYLHRFSYGAPHIKVKTSLEKRAVQVRDFVSISDEVFLSFEHDGLTTDSVWEVVSKEEDPIGDEGSITWELVRVRSQADGFPSFTPDYEISIDPIEDEDDNLVLTNELDFVLTNEGNFVSWR